MSGPEAESPVLARLRVLVPDAIESAFIRSGEQQAYDRLLKLLNAEDLGTTGLTGDVGRDEQLRELIARLKGP